MKMTKILLLAATLFAANGAMAKCDNCGSVTDMKTVQIKGQGSGGGAIVGGVLGGVLGHQVGSGRGNTAATIVGAGAGAYAGNEVEKNSKTKTQYQVIVKLETGESRTFTYNAATAYRVGDRIRVEKNKLVRE
ncbi:MAG: glycine zipper 2TM domain-containing protein [Betaproteobacteria bacterium]